MLVPLSSARCSSARNESVVVVEPGPRDEQFVVGCDGQGQGLGEPFQQHLLRGVDGHEADPWHVVGGAACGPACALQAVPEHVVKGELAGGDLGNAALRRLSRRRTRWPAPSSQYDQ